ncbi:hypothetical protein [Rhizobium leguminosarum]|uniref:hypothetical protein n=1 Tax=Rhizobium leguminosarum TaxID=384 RepID=UPI0014416E25|nr:hypothetical protein [Rhizobium leguminosarum]
MGDGPLLPWDDFDADDPDEDEDNIWDYSPFDLREEEDPEPDPYADNPAFGAF